MSSLDLKNSYLFNRYQNVVVTGTESDWVVVIRGVQQWTILGPLLFNLYVNDMKTASDCQIIQHVDNTILFLSGTNLEP